MIPSPFQVKKKRSFSHKSGKSHKTNLVKSKGVTDVEEGQNLHKENHASGGNNTNSKSTSSLKLCKKWLISELKRVKKENVILRNHLDNPSGNIVQLKEKLSHCKQKRTILKQKYKALCHIHKSSLIELYNLAVQEKNALRNDISLLSNVIVKLNGELSHYERDPGLENGKDPPANTQHLKLSNPREIHILKPLMQAYEAKLADRIALIDKYRREHSILGNHVRCAEVENRELRKSLKECESALAINVHKMERTMLNRDLLTEQNEVLIHKVNQFNATLNLLLSKYETLELENQQLVRKNNSLTRAAKLLHSQYRLQRIRADDKEALDELQNLNRDTEQTQNQDKDTNQKETFVERLAEKKHFILGPTMNFMDDTFYENKERDVPQYEVGSKVEGKRHAKFGLEQPFSTLFGVKECRSGKLEFQEGDLGIDNEVDELVYCSPKKKQRGNPIKQLTKEFRGKEIVDRDRKVGEFFGLVGNHDTYDHRYENENDCLAGDKTGKSREQQEKLETKDDQNKHAKYIINQNNVELSKKIYQLNKEIVLLKERNAFLANRNIEQHSECISKSVHESIVHYFENMFDELSAKYRQQIGRKEKRERNKTKGVMFDGMNFVHENVERKVEHKREREKSLEEKEKLGRLSKIGGKNVEECPQIIITMHGTQLDKKEEPLKETRKSAEITEIIVQDHQIKTSALERVSHARVSEPQGNHQELSIEEGQNIGKRRQKENTQTISEENTKTKESFQEGHEKEEHISKGIFHKLLSKNSQPTVEQQRDLQTQIAIEIQERNRRRSIDQTEQEYENRKPYQQEKNTHETDTETVKEDIRKPMKQLEQEAQNKQFMEKERRPKIVRLCQSEQVSQDKQCLKQSIHEAQQKQEQQQGLGQSKEHKHYLKEQRINLSQKIQQPKEVLQQEHERPKREHQYNKRLYRAEYSQENSQQMKDHHKQSQLNQIEEEKHGKEEQERHPRAAHSKPTEISKRYQEHSQESKQMRTKSHFDEQSHENFKEENSMREVKRQQSEDAFTRL